MKRILLLLLLCALCPLGLSARELFEQPPRVAEVSPEREPVSELEIALPEPTPLLNFAAAELQTFLAGVLGRPVPIVREPSAGRLSLILGDNALLRQSGVDVAALPFDGFVIRRDGNRIYLAGKDSPTADPRGNAWQMWFDRGTLSAVYDFLERFAGVRFYFPGELGTVVPRNANWQLPRRIDIAERPDWVSRKFYPGSGPHLDYQWYESFDYPNGVRGENLNLLRLRMESRQIPNCHGLAQLGYLQRFGNSNPDYFALMPDGRRYKEADMPHTGQLCFSSGIREKIYQDARAFLSGRPASDTGALAWGNVGWNPNAAVPGYFNLMSQDWFYLCHCPKCATVARGGRDFFEQDAQKISNFMWQFNADVANRLKQENIPGYITNMSYYPYHLVPQIELPDNLLVMVATRGPWSCTEPAKLAADDAVIQSWVNKLQHRVWLWNYAIKMGATAMPGIPQMAPRSIARYYQARKDRLFGAFLESETDRYIFNYMTYYMFSKVAWDNHLDADALIAEHDRLMFGAGAAPMRRFFDRLEELWLTRVSGKSVDTALGPVSTPPSENELWNDVYSPAELAALAKLLDDAQAKAAAEPDSLRRIKFMRQEFLGSLQDAAAKYQANQQAIGTWRFALPGRVWLRPFKGEVNEVNTSVDVSDTGDALKFVIRCEEPETPRLKQAADRPDDPRIHADSCVELFLNPSGDRRNYLHFTVNARGTLYDARCIRNGTHSEMDATYQSGASATAQIGNGFWIAELTVPKSALTGMNPAGFPVNFARHRSLDGASPNEVYYQWSPLPGTSFHAVERYGTMELIPQAETNLLSNGNCDSLTGFFTWREDPAGSEIALDNRVFMTGGSSLRLTNKTGKRVNALLKVPAMKPNTAYRLSFYTKTRDLTFQKQGEGAGAYLFHDKGVALPPTQLTGNNPWHKLSFDFTSGPATGGKGEPSVAFWIWFANGEAWFDDMRLEEIR